MWVLFEGLFVLILELLGDLALQFLWPVLHFLFGLWGFILWLINMMAVLMLEDQQLLVYSLWFWLVWIIGRRLMVLGRH